MQAKKQELAWNITRPLHEELPRMSHRLTAFAVNYKIMCLPQTNRCGTIHFTCHDYKNIVTYSCTRDRAETCPRTLLVLEIGLE